MEPAHACSAMASQVAADSTPYEIRSFVRGLHAYDWEPAVGETLQLKREPDNHRDKHAVAVVKADGAIVGHLPYNLAPIVSPFLARDFNKGTAEITGKRVNRGAGYGIEAPCIYRLYGPKKFIQRVEELVVKLRSKALLSSESQD